MATPSPGPATPSAEPHRRTMDGQRGAEQTAGRGADGTNGDRAGGDVSDGDVSGGEVTGCQVTGGEVPDGDVTGGDVAGRVAAVRAFNRFYTPVIGLLRDGLYGSPYSLTEVRVIFELAQRHGCETSALRSTLGLDAGYLSRILARFEADGLITKERSQSDGRRHVVTLTGKGRTAFAAMDSSSNQQVRELLAPVTGEGQRRLVAAMHTIQQVLTAPAGSSVAGSSVAGSAVAGSSQAAPSPAGGSAPAASVSLRPPEPGDLGWVIGRNGAVYADEYGWDKTYEALVARIVADYAADHDPVREAAWIAEADGERAGCVLCVRKDDSTAKLRLLLVEPWARGMGIGGRLVGECVDFAKRNGYREMVLWTQSILTGARRIYQRAGFQLVESEPHHSFGHDLVGETWRLTLG